MDNIDPQVLANLLRNQPSKMPQMQGNQNGSTMIPPNFVPPNINAFPKMRQGDEELLKQYGITPEDLFNFQAQLR
jgi:hypothetical protein